TGAREAESSPRAATPASLAQDDCLVGADVCSPATREIQAIATELSLDPLAVEDAVSRHERPKADRYRTHLFVNSYAVDLDRDTGALRLEEVSAFVLPRALVTVRQDEWFGTERFLSRWDENPDLQK